jgi:hypothetical protein
MRTVSLTPDSFCVRSCLCFQVAYLNSTAITDAFRVRVLHALREVKVVVRFSRIGRRENYVSFVSMLMGEEVDENFFAF